MKEFFKRYVAIPGAASVSTFGVLWTFADSLGVPPGGKAALITAGLAALISIFSILIRRISNLAEEVTCLQNELQSAEAQKSYCCVIDQKTPSCPLGVSRIVEHSEDTIRPSLQRAQRSLRWFGLSAFNVLHNNYDIFEQKRDVRFEFSILSKENTGLHREVDRYFGDVRGKLNAKELIMESEKLIRRVEKDLNAKVNVVWHNQMPTFRIISIDGDLTYVSFYQRGVDALKSFQLELKHDPAIQFPMKDWFDAFLDKSSITERYNGLGAG